MNPPTPSTTARILAGYPVAAAAKRARVTPKYLRDCERAQSFSWALASRLARIYGCSLNLFLPQPGAGARMPRRRSVAASGARRRRGRER